MGTYGSLIEGLRVRHLGLTVTALTPIVNLLLQLFIAVGITQLIDRPVFTIFVFNFAILFSTEFQIYFLPQENKVEQTRAIFNALTYLALNYHLFLFTDFVDYDVFPQIANSVITLIWFNIGVNFTITIGVSVHLAVKKCKQHYMRRKYRIQMAKKYDQNRRKFENVLRLLKQDEADVREQNEILRN